VLLKLQLDLVVVLPADLLIIIDGLKYFKQIEVQGFKEICHRPA
jgi:hypothetical protein